MQIIPNLPKTCSIIELLVKGILCLLVFPYPLLYIKFLIVSLVGYPNVMNGSTLLNKFTDALFTLTKVPLCNCLNLKSLKILTDLGLSLLIPLILMTNANFDSAGT